MTLQAGMKIDFDGRVFDYPGVAQRLVWPVQDEVEGSAAADVVADVAAAFAPLLRPLSIDILLRAFRRASYENVPLAHPFWFAATKGTETDPDVTPSTGRSITVRVDALTPEAIKQLINEAAAKENLGPDVAWTWDEIRVYAVDARLPESLADHDVLHLEVLGGDVGVDVHRCGEGAWVRSPGGQAPELPLVLLMTGGHPVVEIITYWSIWAPGGPGEADLNAVIETLLQRGWLRCQ